jgi:hypothetical protein
MTSNLLKPLIVFCVVLLQVIVTQGGAEKTDIEVSGTVTNVTVGKSTGVTFHITSEDGKAFQARGAYDGKNLFGRFDVPGEVVYSRPDVTCFQFSGDIEFGGGDGSGFPTGTKTTYVMSIMLTKQDVKGVYRIGKIPPDVELEQYGTMDLSRVSKVRP